MTRTMIQTVPHAFSGNQPTPNLTFIYNQPSVFPPLSFPPLFGLYQYAPLAPEYLQGQQTNLPQITTSNTFTNFDVAQSNVSNNGIFHIENSHRQVAAAIPQHKEATSTLPPHHKQSATFSQTVYHPLVADDSEINPTIQNVVATSNIGCKLDLKRISEIAQNTEYNPKRFNALVMRIKEPKSTALLFNSGKMVCLGTKSEESAKLASRKFARILQKLNFPVRFGDLKIRNMVGSCGVDFQLYLSKFQADHYKFTIYEPENFPGLIYKMVEPKITILVFASGKIVLTGAKTREDITRAFKQFYPMLKKYKNNGRFISV